MDMDERNVSGAPSDQEESLTAGQFFLEMVKVFLLAAVIIIPVRTFLFQPFFVEGSSMVPNFEDGEYLVVNELGYKRTDVGVPGKALFTVDAFKELERQKPVVFKSPVKDGQFLIKRVIGLPGESVEIRNSKIIVSNGTHPEGYVLDEREYLAKTVLTSDMAKLTLADDEYFVMGDNRTASYDSRMIGPIRKDMIMGRVLFRAWPISQATAY
jgi:signal peptidase I